MNFNRDFISWNKEITLRVIYLFALFTFLNCFYCKAQVFPYLNASTGCEGHYIVDTDTNVIMYHGNQIEKLDKNFNPIWIKSYAGLDFYSLLLSKTGSFYFISNQQISPYEAHSCVIGKLDMAGNIVWCKTIKNLELQTATDTFSSTNNSFNQIVLDRNNHLVLSGISETYRSSGGNPALFLKMDTLGTVVSFKNMTDGANSFTKVIVTSDSLGNYQLLWNAIFSGFDVVGGYNFVEAQDTINKVFTIYGFSSTFGIYDSKYLISKFDPNVYYSLYVLGNGIQMNPFSLCITKHFKNTIIWSKMLLYHFSYSGPINIGGVDEDGNKNLLFSINRPEALSISKSQFFKVDSLGNPILTKDLFFYRSQSCNGLVPASMPNNKLNTLYGQKYFYDVYGCDFPANPLTLTVMDSLLTPSCAASKSFSLSPGIGISQGIPSVEVRNIINYSDSSMLVSVSNIANFSLVQDTCIDASVNEKNNNNISLILSPNPATNELRFEISNKIELTNLTIIDINGREVYSIERSIGNSVNISNLSQGIYLLKLMTDRGLISRKFIKESN